MSTILSNSLILYSTNLFCSYSTGGARDAHGPHIAIGGRIVGPGFHTTNAANAHRYGLTSISFARYRFMQCVSSIVQTSLRHADVAYDMQAGYQRNES